MSAFQVSAIASADDIAGIFRTSLRSSSDTSSFRGGGHQLKNESRQNSTRENSTSFRDSAIASMESVSYTSWRSSMSNGRGKVTPSRRSRSQPPRSRRKQQQQRQLRAFPSLDYDASIHNDTPFVSRFNQRGEVYTPISHAWEAFKERLFDSSLSEKYEVMHVHEGTRTGRSNRRFMAASLDGDYGDDEEEDDPLTNLLFLQDPLARSMYKNLETYFDRKSMVRAMSNDFTARGNSRRGSQQLFSDFGGNDPPRSQSSLGFHPNSSFSARSKAGFSSTNADLQRPQSSRSFAPSSATTSLFSRRKREQTHPSAIKSDLQPEDVKREIEQRFAKINFEEGTTDYDALFTVSEEMTGKLDEIAASQTGEQKTAGGRNGETGDSAADGNNATPKFKLDHLRF